MKLDKDGNTIHPSAQISENVIFGKKNQIGKNVVIQKTTELGAPIVFGDCNIIHDNTRIVIGEEGLSVGDWNVFHNNMLVIGEKAMKIGHNCWFGQNTVIDSTGGMTIHNGVRAGMYSQLWSHVASGELIEGCTLFGKRPTEIEDNVWLGGRVIILGGVRIGEGAIIQAGSCVVTNIPKYAVAGGHPAKVFKQRDIEHYNKLKVQQKFL